MALIQGWKGVKISYYTQPINLSSALIVTKLTLKESKVKKNLPNKLKTNSLSLSQLTQL